MQSGDSKIKVYALILETRFLSHPHSFSPIVFISLALSHSPTIKFGGKMRTLSRQDTLSIIAGDIAAGSARPPTWCDTQHSH